MFPSHTFHPDLISLLLAVFLHIPFRPFENFFAFFSSYLSKDKEKCLTPKYQSINCKYQEANTFPTEKAYFEYFFNHSTPLLYTFWLYTGMKHGSPGEAKFHHKNSSECKLVYYNGWICNWARWSKSCVLIGTPIYSGFPTLVCHIINPLQINMFGSWWLDTGLVFLCIFIKLDFVSATKNA